MLTDQTRVPPTSPSQNHPFRWLASLRARLLLLMSLALIPVGIFLVYDARVVHDRIQRDAQIELLRLVRLMAVADTDDTSLSQLIANPYFPLDALVLVTDQAGNILAVSQNFESWQGQPLPQGALRQALRSQVEGVVEDTGSDGVQRLYAFSPVTRLGGPEAFTIMGRPTQAIFSGVNQQVADDLLGLGAVLFVALAAIWFGSDWLVLRRIERLVGVTERLAEGDLNVRAPIDSGTIELDQLAQTFNHMVDRLQQREAERQQTETALRASETRFARTFAFSPFPLAITRLADGKIVDLNDAFERLTGYTRAEALGYTPDELRLWVNPQVRADGLKDLRTGALIVNFEADFRMKDGSIVTCVLGGGLVTLDGQQCVVTSLMDVTERKQAEARARVLVQVNELVRQIVNPDEFLYAVAQLVGEYLLTQRSFFVELDIEHDRGFVWRDYCRGVPSVAGEYRLSQYSAETGQEMDRGYTIVNNDSQVDPRTAPYYEKTYAPNGERAYVAVPLMREGHRVAALWVSTDTPRDWRADDVTLLEAVAERAWLAVEKMSLDLEQSRLYEAEQQARVELELRVHERTAELEKSSAQLSSLSARLQAMREEERQRLSRELHDQLGGALTGLKIDISQVYRHSSDNDLQTKLKDLLATIDGIIQIVRQLAMELRPAILDDFGLSAAIEWQLQEFEKRSGIHSRYTPEEIQVELDKEAATAVFRILQEALTNVVRHAQASEVNVQLRHQSNYLILQVHDNGRGISPGDLINLKSLGLVGMRERVRLFSGDLDIQGTPGEGTTVLVRIPLQSYKEHQAS